MSTALFSGGFHFLGTPVQHSVEFQYVDDSCTPQL